MTYSKNISGIVVSGSQVTYSCDSLYKPASTEALVSTCQSDGTWNSSIICHPGLFLRVDYLY